MHYYEAWLATLAILVWHIYFVIFNPDIYPINLAFWKGTLTEREAEVIRLYFGLGREHSLTLEEIGEKFQLTRERVRQIKEKAIRRLRHASRSKQLRAYLG